MNDAKKSVNLDALVYATPWLHSSEAVRISVGCYSSMNEAQLLSVCVPEVSSSGSNPSGHLDRHQSINVRHLHCGPTRIVGHRGCRMLNKLLREAESLQLRH